jgi:heterotetrameric sarcosine oxidase gamma subunit
MAEPRFASPVRQREPISGSAVTLKDVSGVPLARRFAAEVAAGTARRSAGSLEWSVAPGESTLMNGRGGVDLTHVRAVFRLSGPQAAGVLAAVCALDLSDDMLPDLAAGRTSIAGVATELVRDDVEGVPSYLLLPSRSFGNYLWQVLGDAVATRG